MHFDEHIPLRQRGLVEGFNPTRERIPLPVHNQCAIGAHKKSP